MLEEFNCKSSTEKDQLLASKSNNAWFSFCSLFKNADEYDFEQLKTIFQKAVLLDTLCFRTEKNLLHFKILTLLDRFKTVQTVGIRKTMNTVHWTVTIKKNYFIWKMESSEAFSTAREELAGSASVLSTVHSMWHRHYIWS